jgi:hypothetical protein
MLIFFSSRSSPTTPVKFNPAQLTFSRTCVGQSVVWLTEGARHEEAIARPRIVPLSNGKQTRGPSGLHLTNGRTGASNSPISFHRKMLLICAATSRCDRERTHGCKR